MVFMTLRANLSKLFRGRRTAKKAARGGQLASRRFRPDLENLEDRLVPASTITIIAGAAGSGTLDAFLSATDGILATTDGGATAGTVSAGALAGVGPNVDINISATDSLIFNDLGGALTLQTAAGHSATFVGGSGAISFANAANTLATSGGSLALLATTNASLANLTTSGGDITITADTITVPAAINAGAGQVTLQPFTAGRPIDLGGADSATALGLTDAEIDLVTAGKLQIGSGSAGDITLTATVTVTNSSTLVLRTNGGIVDGTGTEQTDLAVSNLALAAVNDVGGGNDLNVAINSLAALVTAGSLNLTDTGALTIDSIDAFQGVIADGDVVLRTVDTLTAGEDITVSLGTIVTSLSGDLHLRAGDRVIVPVGATLQAANNFLEGGFNDAGDAGGVTLQGVVIGPVTITGSAGQDTFIIQPTLTDALTLVADGADIANPLFSLVGAGPSNTLALTGPAFTLNLLDSATLNKIHNLQTLDLRTSPVNYTVPLPKASVRAITGADHTLVVTGDAGDIVQIGNRWLLGTDEVIGGFTFNVYTQQEVTLKVQEGVTGAFNTQTQTVPIIAIDSVSQNVKVKIQEVHGAAGGAFTVPAPGRFLQIAVSTYGAFEAPLIFGLGVDHQIYVERLNPDGTLLDGWIRFAPGLFDALATTTYDNNASTIVFALGDASGDGRQIFSARFDGNGIFRDGWGVVAPGRFKSLAAGSLGAARDRPEVFGIGLDNNFYFARFTRDGVFANGWIKGPAGPVSSLTVAGLDDTTGNALVVFGLNASGRVVSNASDADGLFASPFTLGPADTFTSLAAAGVPNQQVVLFGLGTDHQVRRQTFSSSGVATSGFVATAPGSFTAIAATSVFDGIDLYGISKDQVFGALFAADGTLISGFFPTAAGTFSRVAAK